MTSTTTPQRRRLSFWSGLLLLMNVFVLLLLAAGYFAATVAPDSNWMFAFAGLAFPYAVLVNVIFVFIWMFLWRKLFLISLIALLLCWNRLANYVQWDSSEPSGHTIEEEIKVVSYNVQIFDLYNWKNNRISEKGSNILTLLESERADFICLQEYHAGVKHKVDISDSIIEMTGLRYNQIAFVENNGRVMPYGIAIFSRWPILNKRIIHFENNPFNFCIYSDVVVKGDTVRLFNIHLESIRLSKEDYLYVAELPKATDSQELFSESSRKILRKFKRAFINRASQARHVAQLIDNSPYKVILCGDLNDTPSSYTYHQLSANLTDAFKESGSGIGMTYAGALPSFRIDYILHDESFESFNFQTMKRAYSDHYPISTNIVLH